MLKNGSVAFDDFTRDEYGYWSQICQHCADKYKINFNILYSLDPWLADDGHGICGVSGCENQADFYIDFEESTIKIIGEKND